MKITEDHWLEPVTKDIITGGSLMKVRRCLVIHFTSGATAKSSIKSMRSQGLSCHLVIDRDGTIYQCRAFSVTCGHAGPKGKSRWRDPKTGTLYDGANSFSIGIELANAGDDAGLAGRWASLPLVTAKHRNGGSSKQWEAYPEEQLDACFAAAKVIVGRYNLDDVTGHDCIAPERKNDPGPAFPMRDLREHCGFSGLPAVHQK